MSQVANECFLCWKVQVGDKFRLDVNNDVYRLPDDTGHIPTGRVTLSVQQPVQSGAPAAIQVRPQGTEGAFELADDGGPGIAVYHAFGEFALEVAYRERQ